MSCFCHKFQTPNSNQIRGSNQPLLPLFTKMKNVKDTNIAVAHTYIKPNSPHAVHMQKDSSW